MVGGGLAQVGGKAVLASSVQFPPHLRQAACSLPAVLLVYRLILPLKSLFLPFQKKVINNQHFYAQTLYLSAFSTLFALFYQPLCSQSFQRVLRGGFRVCFWFSFYVFCFGFVVWVVLCCFCLLFSVLELIFISILVFSVFTADFGGRFFCPPFCRFAASNFLFCF